MKKEKGILERGERLAKKKEKKNGITLVVLNFK
jgi:hypothetical protein